MQQHPHELTLLRDSQEGIFSQFHISHNPLKQHDFPSRIANELCLSRKLIQRRTSSQFSNSISEIGITDLQKLLNSFPQSSK